MELENDLAQNFLFFFFEHPLVSPLLRILILACFFVVLTPLKMAELGLRRKSLLPGLFFIVSVLLLLQSWLFFLLWLKGEATISINNIVNYLILKPYDFRWCSTLIFAFEEEILFRAFLFIQMYLLFKKRYPASKYFLRQFLFGLVLSQTLFALYHIPNRLMYQKYSNFTIAFIDQCYLFYSGIIHIGIYLWTKNIIVTFGAHFLFNLSSHHLIYGGIFHEMAFSELPTWIIVEVPILFCVFCWPLALRIIRRNVIDKKSNNK